MQRTSFLLFVILFILYHSNLKAQSNNALSIYEGERIQSVQFSFTGMPEDTLKASSM